MFRGSGINILDLILKVAVTLVLTPAMVQALNVEGYGLWVLVTSISGYGALLEMGITFSASRFLGMAVGVGNVDQQGLIFTTVSQFFRLIAAVLLVLTPVIVLVAGLTVSGSHHHEFELALLIVCLMLVLRFRFRLPVVFLRANSRYDLIAQASILRSILQAGLLIWLLAKRPSIIGVACVQIVMEGVELYCLARFAAPLIPATVPPPDTAVVRDLRRDLLRYARSISILMVGESLRGNLNPMVVDRVSGLASVPLYSIGMRLITIIQDTVGAIFGGPVISIFSQLHGAGDEAGLRSIFIRSSRWAASFSTFAVLGACWLASPFFHRWVGPNLWGATDVMHIVAGPYLLYFAQYPAHNLLYTLDKNHWLSWMAIAGGCFSAVLSIAFGMVWGLHGVVSAIALEMLISRLFVLPIMVAKVIHVPATEYIFKHLLLSSLRSSIPPLLGIWLFHRWVQPDYGSLFLAGSGYTLVCLLLMPWFILQTSERHEAWTLLKKKLRLA
ncbi:lipopolysaccharide biosynthesis protein [Prosthecobacter dejongeii]|uniref:O-antigen/teichoic acid export membrane protein n=1 Tax=Prosthecobacter dejongeii TaxID=48465 RepID=A0A7W7YIF5_9BACT|nr:lipopolysaccharide biosynthesis protein [Prosthecobacter dejongeii]MBB5036686.1 O-antigen/teichoic acid export membrane protein [Prosthecobacter dejongeii]